MATAEKTAVEAQLAPVAAEHAMHMAENKSRTEAVKVEQSGAGQMQEVVLRGEELSQRERLAGKKEKAA
jgi:hypothetical protein